MKALSIRNLPDDVYEALKKMASANHRSMQEQVRCLIERETRLARGSGLEVAHAWRLRLAGRSLGDTVEDARQDRAR
jgi:plasmid stability protein